MPTPSETRSNPAGVLVRVLMPVAVIAAGWYGFTTLSQEVEKKAPPPARKLMLRTKVQDLEVGAYQIVVSTNAVVQPHNRVTLSAEVAGVVVEVSPSFEVGAYFEKGDVLVKLDRRNFEAELAIAKAQVTSQKSALQLAKLVEDRKIDLVEFNAVSQAEVDAAKATREQAEAAVELAETQLAQAQLNLDRTTVVAPFDGRVETQLIGVGQMAGANAPLGDVFAVDFAEVRLPISGEQRRYLKLPEFADDDPLYVTFYDAIVDSNDHVWQGKIVRTEGVLDVDSRDLFAIARIDDPFGRRTGGPPLRIGQPVNARIQGEVLEDVVALPRGAVRQLDKIVLVEAEKHTLHPMNITPVWSDAQHVVVRASTIPDGMLLATTPMTYTPEGSEVEIIPDAETVIADTTDASSDEVAN